MFTKIRLLGLLGILVLAVVAYNAGYLSVIATELDPTATAAMLRPPQKWCVYNVSTNGGVVCAIPSGSTVCLPCQPAGCKPYNFCILQSGNCSDSVFVTLSSVRCKHCPTGGIQPTQFTCTQ